MIINILTQANLCNFQLLIRINNNSGSFDWISNTAGWAADRWGHGTYKSPFDPCPEGWRVPDFSFTSRLINGSYDNGHGLNQISYGGLGSGFNAIQVTVEQNTGIIFDDNSYRRIFNNRNKRI